MDILKPLVSRNFDNRYEVSQDAWITSINQYSPITVIEANNLKFEIFVNFVKSKLSNDHNIINQIDHSIKFIHLFEK